MSDTQKRLVFERYFNNILTKTAHKLSSSKAGRDLPALSLVAIISSLRVLAIRGSKFAEFSHVPGDFFSWQRPSLTFTGLSIYTIICINPQLVVVLPVVGILGSTFIPQYAKKYMVPEQTYIEKMREMQATAYQNDDEVEQEPGERDLINMLRHIQTALVNLVGVLEWVDHIRETLGDFTDPHESSALFILSLGMLIVGIVVSNYVNLKAVFIFGGWFLMGLMHPGVRAIVEDLALEVEELEKSVREWKFFALVYKVLKDQFQYSEEELVREVEVFEIEKQGLTSRFWEPVGYSPTLDHKSRSFGHKFTKGNAKLLHTVEAPYDWYFIDSEPWTLDANPAKWLDTRQIDNLSVVNGWVHSINGKYRTRRHYRKCIYRPQKSLRKPLGT